MKKSMLILSLALSLLIALSGCAEDTKVSEIDVENKPVSRSLPANEPQAETAVPDAEQPQSEASAPASDAPVGMRKFFNYNGYRYAFVEDGKSFDFSSLSLGESLGTLEYDIVAGMANGNPVSDKEFSTSFAVGGSLYAHPDYDPAFRLIVEQDGQYYLAELVGKTDNSTIEPSYFFQHSRLSSDVSEGAVLNHIGDKTLLTLDQEESQNMLTSIAESTPAELTSDDYQQIASTQSDGKSYQLRFSFPDDTCYSMYLIPELELISIGDDYYCLPEHFTQDYADLIASLPADIPPMN